MQEDEKKMGNKAGMAKLAMCVFPVFMVAFYLWDLGVHLVSSTARSFKVYLESIQKSLRACDFSFVLIS